MVKFSPMNRIAILRSYIERDPTDMFTRHALAMELVKIGDDLEAQHVMDEIIAIDEFYVGTYYHLGKLCERIVDRLKAEAVYTKGIVLAEQVKDSTSLRELKAALQQLKDESIL
jgi:predicted Zn-dependent protease